MSMSTHVCGFKPPDEKWRKMKAVWDSCVAAGLPLPDGVEKFFEYCGPDESGVRVEIEKNAAVNKYQGNASSGFEVDLTKLDPDVKIIRFWNGW
jgi:hypothetical protein